jgi:hypothetical protein
MSATDPSRKWSFRRSLPQLGTACNLRFFACIHTSAFIKETLRKLDWIRSQLYEQLRRRPKHRFSQNHTLHTMHTQKHARTAQKTIFSPARKSGPRAQHTQNPLITLICLLNIKQCWMNYHAPDPEDAPARTFSHRLPSKKKR